MALASIVIPVFNRAELTRQCLDSLREARARIPTEIVVVDNGSSDGTKALLHERRDSLRSIRNPENAGFAVACNQGAELARGDYVVLLNNDTIAQPGWLDALVEMAASAREIEIVGSRLLYPDGTIQHAGAVMSRPFRTPYHFYSGRDGDDPAVSYPRELRVVTGACMLVKREAWRRHGGLDTGYRNGFEDADLCLRVCANGGRVFYQPESRLYHLESRTEGRHEAIEANTARFLESWGDARWSDEDLVYFEDGLRTWVAAERDTLVPKLGPITSPEQYTGYAQIARVQRALLVERTRDLRTAIGRPEDWLAEPSVLDWIEDLCASARLDDLADAFARAGAACGSRGAEVASREQLRRARAAAGGRTPPDGQARREAHGSL